MELISRYLFYTWLYVAQGIKAGACPGVMRAGGLAFSVARSESAGQAQGAVRMMPRSSWLVLTYVLKDFNILKVGSQVFQDGPAFKQ